MKIIKLLMAAVCAVAMPLASCSHTKNATTMEQENNNGKKAIVCYFSATGITEAAAKRIAKIADADIYRIEPAEAYTAADLDWTDSLSRSSVEMHNKASRPALADSTVDLTGYTVVYLGYPNWWNTHPTLINTFIEANDLKGKLIVPFMTSGGSNILNSEKELREQYPGLTFGEGLLMNGKSDAEVAEWTEQFKQ